MDSTMIDEKTKIGKDVIESLTLAMYDDPKFIYREYIQNSADQIDIAIESGLISNKDECKIEISINKIEKRVTIYDNGTGVQSEKVLPVLRSIAQGVKDRTKHKGFRGIGRLGGLAYCDRLIFETSFFGESTKSILTWNAKELKHIINDRTKKEDASVVIDSITSFQTDCESPEKRYFKVILENVSNDILLNQEEIFEYLSMVAPVPYKKGFLFQNQIYEKAAEYGQSIDEYVLYLNNNQVFKEYTTSIYEGEKHNKKRVDEIFDIEFLEIKNSKEELLCWGWYSISKMRQQMPDVNIAKGIRLRKGNIQIGDENRLSELFVINNVQDKRFSFYFFGEIHTLSFELIPNARRDYFLENETFNEFEKALRSEFRNLKDYCYLSSNVRSEERKIERLTSFREEFSKKVKDGFTKPKEQEEYEVKLKQIKEEAEKARERIEKIKEKVREDGIKSKIVNKLSLEIQISDDSDEIHDFSNQKTRLLTDNLQRLNRSDRKLVGKVLSIIDNILPKDLSDNVKSKIIEELNKQR
jgi:hypothetical protein